MTTADPWYTCTHSGIGLPGCPTCDARIDDDTRRYLRDARDEMFRLRHPPQPNPSSRAPRTLTVVLANTLVTEIAIVHEGEHRPFLRRTVQIDLTPEQRAALEPRVAGESNGRQRHEEILTCWLEPGEVTDAG